MDIQLTKNEKYRQSVKKSQANYANAGPKFLRSLNGEWAVSINFVKSFAQHAKTPDYRQHVRKIIRAICNAIDREFHGRCSKNRSLFIPVIEGMDEYKSTHLHLILGNLGIQNKSKITRRLARIFSKFKLLDVEYRPAIKKRARAKPLTLIKTGVLARNASHPHINTRKEKKHKGFVVERIYDEGFEKYICKEGGWQNGFAPEIDLFQLPISGSKQQLT